MNESMNVMENIDMAQVVPETKSTDFVKTGLTAGIGFVIGTLAGIFGSKLVKKIVRNKVTKKNTDEPIDVEMTPVDEAEDDNK